MHNPWGCLKRLHRIVIVGRRQGDGQAFPLNCPRAVRAVKVQYSQVKERRESFKTNTNLPRITEVLQVTERGSRVCAHAAVTGSREVAAQVASQVACGVDVRRPC